MTDDTPQTGSSTEAVSQLQNIARNLSVWAQSIVNASPAATSATSPKFTGVTLSTTAAVVIGTSTLRHGIMFHNVGNTANVYLYQTGMSSAPTTSALAGSIVIYPGGTLPLPSPIFPNINAGFSAFTNTGTAQPFTCVEFF